MKKSAKKRVGVLGGSFNPIQIAHLLEAAELLHCGLDEVWIVPCGPRNDKPELESALHRFIMAQEAVDAWFGSGFPVKVLSTEVFLRKALSTYQLMKKLSTENPDYNLYFVLGADLYAKIDDWKNARRLLKEVKFIVVERPGYELPKTLRASFTLLKPINGNQIAKAFVSASEVRYRLEHNISSAEGLVPGVALAHIIRYGLYGAQKEKGGK